jgi:hypothetical protein
MFFYLGVKEEERPMKTIILVFLAFILCGCAAIPKDPHPELNRVFRPGIDTPGEYPY